LKNGFTKETSEVLDSYLDSYKIHYQKKYNTNADLVEKKMAFYESNGFNIQQEKNQYFNESLSDLVRNTTTKERIMEYKGSLIQIINPVFQSPKPNHFADYRGPFFIPEKNLLGTTVGTFTFNLMVIWSMTLLFYITLYFEWLRKFVNLFSNFSLSLKK
jgi:hypothetical protein